MSSNPLPKGWVEAPPVGTLMKHFPFIPAKAPLRETFSPQWTPQNFVQSINSQYSQGIGAIVDLTYTSKYYGRSDIPGTIEYKKIACAGDSVPQNQYLQEFIDYCRNFHRNNPNKLIVVHCTHGYNRTGYFIVTYLIEELRFSMDEALSQFKNARGPSGIYRRHLLVDLHDKYKSGVPFNPQSIPAAPPGLEDEGSEASPCTPIPSAIPPAIPTPTQPPAQVYARQAFDSRKLPTPVVTPTEPQIFCHVSLEDLPLPSARMIALGRTIFAQKRRG